MAADLMPLAPDSQSPESPAALEAAAHADMAAAAYAVLAPHFSHPSPVDVRGVGVDAVRAAKRRHSTRVYLAEHTVGKRTLVEVGGASLDASHIAAAVACGLAFEQHPPTGPSNRAERARLQRVALHRVSMTPRAPTLGSGRPTVDGLLADKHPDTSPLARAIVAAQGAQDGRSAGGARAVKSDRTGGRFMLEWTEENESGSMRKTFEVRPAASALRELVGQVVSLALITEAGKSHTLRAGKLIWENKESGAIITTPDGFEKAKPAA